MTDVTDHNHDLEDHITTLRKLDEARRRSAELRDEGIEVLMEYLHLPKKKEEPPAFGDWRRERSLIVRALLTLQDQPFSDEEKEAKRLKLIKSLTNQLQKNFSLKALAENELSVLMAASVLQALTVRPGGAFSKTAMLCYYWIIRELYSANWSDWNIGGARAAPGGLVTAFTTGECVRALWSFAEAQRNTGKFIEEAGKYLERMKELENLNNVYFSAEKSSNPLEKWVKAEKKRLRLSCYLNLRRLSRYLVLPLDPSEIILCDPSIWSTDDDEQKKELIKQFLNKNTVLIVEVAKGTKWVIAWLDDKGEPKIKVVDEALIIKDVDEKLKEVEPDRDKIKQCLNLSDNKTITKIIKLAQFEDLLKAEIQKVKDDFSEALQKIREYRNGHCEVIGEKAEEILKDLEEYLYHDVLSTPSALEKNQYRDITRSESAHLIAAMAVKDASYRVQKVLDIFGKDDKKVYEKIKRGFDEAADKVQKLMHPVKNYLSSVLDRELALVSLGESWDWQPCELACAAASYGRLTNDWKKEARFSRAVGDLSKMISSCGRFANPRHIHERPDGGGRLMLGNAVILHAMAQLLRYTRDNEIEPDLADKMLRFFEDTKANQPRDAWRFSVIDITPDMIKKLGGETDQNEKVTYIREKLPQKMQKLLEIAKVKDLPIPFVEAIVEQLVKTLNELLQAGPIDKGKLGEQTPFTEAGGKIRTMLVKEKFQEGERYYFRLLNRLCLQEVLFPKDIQEADVKQAVKQTLSDKKGWAWEFSQPPLKTGLTATAHAVLALAEINEMLDARINHMILEHFSVKKKGKELDAGLTLDSLFYPDYGLLQAPEDKDLKIEGRDKFENKDWPEKIKRDESVAIILQQMRAHVSRVGLPKNYDSLYSLVLHGPAGTGKTTLVEALAVTCEVPMVEVTPSDLVKRGEKDIEQRARAVFEALSMLTRAVILFDEFDPVLKRRDAGNNNKPLSVFSFLTPGMLPKLKDLNGQAKKRSVAYVLITNLIGELDEAAVRQGRFDERLGIYPPDLLSRAGRLLDQMRVDLPKEVPWDRIVEVIKKTAGKGMTAIGKPGWYTRPKKEVTARTLFGYVWGMADKFEVPEDDDELKGIRGEGRTAVTECLQWMWIREWDGKLKHATYDDLVKALKEGLSLAELPEQEKYLKFVSNSRHQWEVMEVDNIHELTTKWFIRRSKNDPDKK